MWTVARTIGFHPPVPPSVSWRTSSIAYSCIQPMFPSPLGGSGRQHHPVPGVEAFVKFGVASGPTSLPPQTVQRRVSSESIRFKSLST